MNSEWESLRHRLEQRRQEILVRVNALHADLHAREEPLSADFAEQAVELENLDVLFELDHLSRQELARLNDAISRLDAGQYGQCSVCGVPIDKGRLHALPYVDTCIACARSSDELTSFTET